MLNKTFVQCLFGTPHEWLDPYFAHFGRLGEFGWNMKVFTPHKFDVPPNVEIIPMDLSEFDSLVEKYCGVNPRNHIEGHAPKKLISDYYCAFGAIFQDYLKGVDFWGITNFDVVYGRLDRFIPDSILEDFEIWADEPTGINGIFTLFKNMESINRLYRGVPGWEECFTTHQPCAFDEVRMTKLVRQLAAEDRILFGHPPHFPLHSYDRLIQHRPKPNLYFESDGALIERFEDSVSFPNEKGHYGREIFAFHFSSGKRWPVAA